MVQQRARRLPAHKRRLQIIESARGVFASQSYGKVGTADLARAAGISEPALYRHFASKKDLFIAALQATGPRLLEIWQDISAEYEDPLETLQAIGVYYYDRLESHAANMQMQFRALSEADDPEIRTALRDNFEAFVSFIADTLDEGKARGTVRKEVDSRMIAWQFLGSGMTLDLMHLLGYKGEMDRARAALWGRVYTQAVEKKGAAKPGYISEGAPLRVAATLGDS